MTAAHNPPGPNFKTGPLRWGRPKGDELEAALDYLRDDDVLIVANLRLQSLWVSTNLVGELVDDALRQVSRGLL